MIVDWLSLSDITPRWSIITADTYQFIYISLYMSLMIVKTQQSYHVQSFKKFTVYSPPLLHFLKSFR